MELSQRLCGRRAAQVIKVLEKCLSGFLFDIPERRENRSRTVREERTLKDDPHPSRTRERAPRRAGERSDQARRAGKRFEVRNRKDEALKVGVLVDREQ